MTALAADRGAKFEIWEYKRFTLASGNKAYKGAMAALDRSTGKVEPAHAETDLVIIGEFDEQVDATAADKPVNIKLSRRVVVHRKANAGGGGALSGTTDLLSLCYVLDDQTVTKLAEGTCVAGLVWDVDATKGVAVEYLPFNDTLSALLLRETDPGAFAANDLVIPNNPPSGAIYEIPATAAASTVTLPATAVEGCCLTFVADGTLNAHTVQYRDVATAITAALTAAKRHCTQAFFLNGKWRAVAHVSP